MGPLSLFSLALVFFLIIDPVGKVSSYMEIVKDFPGAKRNRILGVDLLVALAFMIGFNYLGEGIFNALGLSDAALHVSAGVILFLAAIKILFPTTEDAGYQIPEGELFIIPIAIPMVAGPALLAQIMLNAHLVPDHTTMLTAIVIAWLLSAVIFYFAPVIQRIMGRNGLMACERLMGMILVLMGVQRFFIGIKVFVASL